MEDFDSDKFRKVLGYFPTGVTIITASGKGTDGEEGGEHLAGFSVGSFASVSLDPPLVMFCAGKESQSWPAIEAAGRFCVNVLSQSQSDLSNRFASKDKDKFKDLKWETRASGAPVLEGVLCWIDCEIQEVIEAGDHFIVLGRVLDLDVYSDEAPSSPEEGPLIFFKGSYNQIQKLG